MDISDTLHVYGLLTCTWTIRKLCGCQRYTCVNGPMSSTSDTRVTYGDQMLQKKKITTVYQFAYVNNTTIQKYHK